MPWAIRTDSSHKELVWLLLEKYMATHSSTLAWNIPWTEGPGRLTVHGVAKSQTRLSDFIFTFHFHALEREMATHSSILAWRIPGTEEPGGLPSMGSHRVRYDWSDLAAAAAWLLCSGWRSAQFAAKEGWQNIRAIHPTIHIPRKCSHSGEIKRKKGDHRVGKLHGSE